MNNKIKGLTLAKPNKSDFDFDYWCNLAKKDPSAFEAAREKEINQHLSEIADKQAQERLRRLQWRVEMERKRSKNPMDSAVRIYDMMWASVSRSIDALGDLSYQMGPKKEQKAKKTAQANVLKFKQEEAETTVS